MLDRRLGRLPIELVYYCSSLASLPAAFECPGEFYRVGFTLVFDLTLMKCGGIWPLCKFLLILIYWRCVSSMARCLLFTAASIWLC